MKKDNKKIYILDTSALLTYIEDEEGADFIDDLLIKAEDGDVIIFISLYKLNRNLLYYHAGKK